MSARTAAEWADRNADMLKAAWSDLDKLRAVNAELVAALDNLIDCYRTSYPPAQRANAWDQARAALAAAKGAP